MEPPVVNNPQWRREHDDGRHLKFAAATEFARKLKRLMNLRDLSQSDLARAIWGETETAAGTPAAKNRDRISKYLAGRTVPDPITIKLLAETLGCDPAELAPTVVIQDAEHAHPEIQMTLIPGHSDRVHVTINCVMSLSSFLQIAAILQSDETRRAPTQAELQERDKPAQDTSQLRASILQNAGLTPLKAPPPLPANKPPRRKVTAA